MKIRLTAFIALSLIVLSFTSTERDKKFIYWDQRPLTWEDFKGHGPRSSPYSATTSSAIHFGFSGQESVLTFAVHTIFDPKQSWKKKGASDHLLNHEQRHFDITEIYARMLRKEIQETKFKKYENLSADIQKIYQKNYSACDKFQDVYDNETDHSKKKDVQLLWNTKIDSLLNVYKDWSQPEFTVDVSYLVK